MQSNIQLNVLNVGFSRRRLIERVENSFLTNGEIGIEDFILWI
jgi:hypothetical protein